MARLLGETLLLLPQSTYQLLTGDNTMKKGLRSRFFHPHTMGVMHWGTVVKVNKNGTVRIKFDIDNKTYTTYADHFGS